MGSLRNRFTTVVPPMLDLYVSVDGIPYRVIVDRLKNVTVELGCDDVTGNRYWAFRPWEDCREDVKDAIIAKIAETAHLYMLQLDDNRKQSHRAELRANRYRRALRKAERKIAELEAQNG